MAEIDRFQEAGGRNFGVSGGRILVHEAGQDEQPGWTTFRTLAALEGDAPARSSTQRDELFERYSELHLACGRAAAAFRLAGRWDAPEDELLARFEREEHRAEAISKRILAVRDSMNLEPEESP